MAWVILTIRSAVRLQHRAHTSNVQAAAEGEAVAAAEEAVEVEQNV
jgi:hypothetical protein